MLVVRPLRSAFLTLLGIGYVLQRPLALPLDFEELAEGAAGGEGGWGGSKEEGRTAKLNYTQFVL